MKTINMNARIPFIWTYAFVYLAASITGCNAINIIGIRLSNGSGSHEGRVEISIDGVWGTVCDYSFDIEDAEVMCRMMNLTATTYYSGAHFGEGLGPVFAREFGCSGSETHLQDCTFVPNDICSHSRDVGILCTECGELSIPNGEIVSADVNGSSLLAKCNTDNESKSYESYCDSTGQWEPITCLPIGYHLDITGIQLTNGIGLFDGRIEVHVNGTWGTICSTNFGHYEAWTICNILGYKGYEAYYWHPGYYGQGNGPVYIDQLHCLRMESALNDCSYFVNNSCNHNQDVGIACTNTPLNVTNIRLVNGTGPYDGLVEIMANDEWGKVCNRFVNTAEAKTFCKMMNRSFVGYSSSTTDALDTTPILIGIMSCGTPRDHINECSYYSPRPDLCQHSNDLSLICAPCNLDFVHGYLADVNGTEFKILCSDGYLPEEVYLTCLENGTLSYEEMCESKYAYPLNISDIRLSESRVEILVDGVWGTICYNGFDSNDGNVICGMLGLTFYYRNGEGTGPIFMENLVCNGSEAHIRDCSYNVSNFCTHSDDVRVWCSKYPLNITDIRLAGTLSSVHGRVEVEVDGEWGTVCDDSFGSSDAEVICRMLGFTSVQVQYFPRAHYGHGTGQIFIDDLSCQGYENHINECHYIPEHNCRHGEDTSVRCFNDVINITEANLQNGTSQNDGRAEIKVNDTWGTICDYNFGTLQAEAFCNLLGKSATQYFTGAKFGQGSGPIYDIYCDNNIVRSCRYQIADKCTHDKDVSVVCNENPLNNTSFTPITDIRLAGTLSSVHGRVEVQVDGEWGTVCDDGFGSSDAEVICRMLGFSNVQAQYFPRAYYGGGTGQIFVEHLSCQGYENHIDECNYIQEHNCVHSEDVSVKCFDEVINITEANLQNGTSPNDGRAEIKVNDTWGTICDYNFGTLQAEAFCNLLGKRATQYFTGAKYGPGSGLIYDIYCDNDHVSSCRYQIADKCTHDKDVSVVCNECGLPEISYYFTYNGSKLYADCSYYKSYLGTLTMKCDNATKQWITEGECIEYSYPLTITSTRLVGGYSESSGRVELYSVETWGTVCDNSFGMNEANVICSMIGFPGAVAYYGGAWFGEGSGPIFIDELTCPENGTDLNACTYVTQDDCSHLNDVSVECTGCRSLVPVNGYSNSTASYEGASVRILCENGYNLIGDSVVVCENGTWSDKPTCKLIDCGNPKPKHGSRNTTVTTNGTVAMIQCDEGYNMSGEAVISCLADESWTDYPSCEIIDCKNAVPNECSANTTDTIYGTVVKIMCPPGCNISEDFSIVCQSDGTWSDTPICNTSDCGVLSLANGKVNTTLGTTIDSVATLECYEGYSLKGSPLVACTASGWNDSSVACEIQACDDPTPSNGTITSTDGSNSYVFRNYVVIECNVGYELKGDSVITCENGGVWSDQPSCILRDSKDLNEQYGSLLDCAELQADLGPYGWQSKCVGFLRGADDVLLRIQMYTNLGERVEAFWRFGGGWESWLPATILTTYTDDSDVDGNNYKIIITVSTCMVVLTATIIGLVAVIIRRKRKSKRRKIDSSLNEVPGKRVIRKSDSSLNEVPGRRVKRNNVSSLNEVPGKRVKRNNVPGRCQTTVTAHTATRV